MKQARQGDIFLERVGSDSVTTGKPIARDGQMVVLAKGLATGHIHGFREPDAEQFEGPDRMQTVVRLPTGGALVHTSERDHGPIPLEPGEWLVTRQRQYFPDGERAVED